MKTNSKKNNLILFLNKYNLLYSKIAPHGNAPNNVPRLQCLHRLSDPHWQTALIVAPAGFGKSNLLRQYVCNQTKPYCWISLSADENDIYRFVYYLIAAIKSANSAFDRFDTLTKGLTENMGTFKTSFINELVMFETPLVMVIEDFHCIDNTQIKDLVRHLINHLPEHIKIMLSSRKSISLNLAKHRLERKIIEIYSADLRFTRNEIAFMFLKYSAISLSEFEIKKIEQRTEGWPAALQLVYMLEKGEKPNNNNLPHFNNIYIQEYIREEILEHYPDSVKDFLLKSSILPSLTPALCQAITGIHNAGEILTELQKSNTFIILLDNNDKWFRFHHIFGDVLHKEFIASYSDEERSLIHKKASLWYENNGYLQEAINNAINSKDYVFIDEFLDRNVEGRVLLGQLDQLTLWFSKLEEKKISSPIAKIWIAWLKLFSLNIDRPVIDYLINCASHGYKNQQESNDVYSSIPVHIAAIQGFIATFDENYHTSIQLSTAALQKLHTIGIVNKSLEGTIFFNLARAHLSLSNLTKTIHYARAAEQLGFSIGNYYGAIASVNLSAQAMIQMLDIDGAEKLYLETLKFSLKNNLADQPFAAYLYNGLGEIEYLRNNFDRATVYLKKSVELSSRGKEMKSLVNAHKLLATIYSAQKNKRRLHFHIRKLDELALKISAKNCLRDIKTFKAHIGLLEKNISPEQLFGTNASHCTIDDFTDTKEYEMFIHANKLMIQKQPEEALKVIHHHMKLAEKLNRKLSQLNFQFSESRALAQLGRRTESIKTLITAIELSLASGVGIFFVQAKKWLPFNLAANITPTIALTMLQSMYEEESDCAYISDLYKNALTKRELEVIGKMKKGLSNKQIADNMCISEGTVKRHAHNIFSKLNVKNRVAAIQC
jgi:LuxR family maltose regulon positive regulatory protein